MKKKRRLQKVTMAAGVVVMSVGLFQTFNAEAEVTGAGCFQKMKYCGGEMTVYNCVTEYTSTTCGQYYYDCLECDLSI